MNARYLASAGGRFAHAALSLSFALAAYSALATPGPTTTRGVGVGLVAIIFGFVLAAVLSAQDFFAYTLQILFFVPLAGSCFIMGLAVSAGSGPAVGVPVALVGAVVFVTGFVWGLGPLHATDSVPAPALREPSTATAHR